jgi:hypothetical protein
MMWPEFNHAHLAAAMRRIGRERRYGRLAPTQGAGAAVTS